ncbi:hypothetical protein Moror_10208 [Moniliophthora roreri MCA 2997]|uniref:Six-hairpin glycosidase n=1 Tax=Moniliophthora roreri (strain MCA 2997) TaxID=1381753 RepID=V2WRZ2_MONRO|nr:hypothetical protein Moror_10208 [Moniliophthora roreri MCA 2997]
MLLPITFAILLSTSVPIIAGNPIFPFDPGFNIRAVTQLAQSLPSHSWEYGTASEALLELYNASLSVFNPCPTKTRPYHKDEIPALRYAKSKILVGSGINALGQSDGAVGDPASLGVFAYMLGGKYASAAGEELHYLVKEAPRWDNGAISHRVEEPELWADFVYMAPPFLAYYAAVTQNESLLEEAVKQCEAYREVLSSSNSAGLWKHIVGPMHPDGGLWATGNAWAAAGMTRVLATIMHMSDIQTPSLSSRVEDLTKWIKEVLDAIIESPSDQGLLRNYLNDDSWFGDTSSTSLLASVAYRIVVLRPDVFDERYIKWADGVRRTLSGGDHVRDDGVVRPAVNPMNWFDREPFESGSPEGQSFVVLMYAAWRDCVLVGRCDRGSDGGGSKRSIEEVLGLPDLKKGCYTG